MSQQAIEPDEEFLSLTEKAIALFGRNCRLRFKLSAHEVKVWTFSPEGAKYWGGKSSAAP